MADIILTISDGTTDYTYTPNAVLGSKRDYVRAAAGLSEQQSLTVDHILRPVGAKGSDRHIVTLRRGDVDDTTGEFTQCVVKFELVVPRVTAFSDTIVKDVVRQLTSYLTATNIVALKNGATPEGDYNVTGPFNPA
jgi:hypothetical protein